MRSDGDDASNDDVNGSTARALEIALRRSDGTDALEDGAMEHARREEEHASRAGTEAADASDDDVVAYVTLIEGDDDAKDANGKKEGSEEEDLVQYSLLHRLRALEEEKVKPVLSAYERLKERLEEGSAHRETSESPHEREG